MARGRAILVLVSTLGAHGVMTLSGAWLPAERAFHQWWNGVSVTFVFIFFVLMFLTLRGRLATKFWPIPIGALIGYFAATVAYLGYFTIMDVERIQNTFRPFNLLEATFVLFGLLPSAMLTWLFGAIAGAVFCLGRFCGLRQTAQVD
jgi:hypothetical protein